MLRNKKLIRKLILHYCRWLKGSKAGVKESEINHYPALEHLNKSELAGKFVSYSHSSVRKGP